MSETTPSHNEHDSDLAIAPAVAPPKIRRPSRWQVVVLNDDHTPMDFVVRILMEIFDMPSSRALYVMLSIHQTGRGIAGMYSKDIAATKCRELHNQAEAEGFPLRAIVERVPGSESET